jgi:hypothetical protein
MVKPKEINHLEHKFLGAVIARVSQGDRQSNPPEENRLISKDHFVERVWAGLEMVVSKPQPFECVEVYEVEATAPIHEGLGELGCPDQWVDYEGKPPWLRDVAWVVCSVKI